MVAFDQFAGTVGEVVVSGDEVDRSRERLDDQWAHPRAAHPSDHLRFSGEPWPGCSPANVRVRPPPLLSKLRSPLVAMRARSSRQEVGVGRSAGGQDVPP